MAISRKVYAAGIVVGALLTAAPVVGLLGTMFGMMRAFSVLGQSGTADPKALSDSISTTLLSTATGLFLFFPGFIILTLSLILFFVTRHPQPPPVPPLPPPNPGNAEAGSSGDLSSGPPAAQ